MEIEFLRISVKNIDEFPLKAMTVTTSANGEHLCQG